MREQVVGGDQDLALAVEEDGVGGGVAGPEVHLERAVAQLDRLAVVQRPRHVRARAPGAEGARDRLQRRRHVLGDAVAEHHVAGELVVGLGLVARSSPRTAPRRRCAATSAPECAATSATRPRWSMCWWVRITSSMSSSEWPSAARPALQLVERGARVGPGVDQRQRLVLDQVDVHAADRERGGDREAVDARLGGGGEGVVGTSGSARAPRRASAPCAPARPATPG